MRTFKNTIIVTILPPEDKVGLLFLPTDTNYTKVERANVVAIAKDLEDSGLEVGDEVLIQTGGGVDFKVRRSDGNFADYRAVHITNVVVAL